MKKLKQLKHLFSRERVIFVSVAATLLVLVSIGAQSFVISPITTGSMEPIVPAGSIILVQKTEDVKPRDVISFNEPVTGKRITHTFAGYEQDGSIMTKGEANADTDAHLQPLQKSDVVGKVVFVMPLFARTFWLVPDGLTVKGLVVGLIMLITITSASVVVVRGERAERRQRKNDMDKSKILEPVREPHPV